ncbi:MBL fold metallo-hydrolase [Treponema sp.]|uniref:MBL fold metallo-hydrolase n=1 Tax=Treponema sp. TaxID=166 RepID=UPI00298E6F00|nr:MBL fold metallo-hydrolase [Treponema sp.]MCR5614411.1 MBL fold metallo-hydrolase [Treponema sp.]
MNKNAVYTFDTPPSNGINWFSPSIGFFYGPTNIGIIAVTSKDKPGTKDVYLIDSGPDKTMAQKLLDSLKAELKDFNLKAIIDTHSHADHCGANAELVRQTGAKVYSTLMEKSSIECPQNQSSIAYGGCPLPEYMSSYYLAEPSLVDQVISSDECFTLQDDTTLQCIPLPGHYFEMVGILCTQVHNGTKVSVFFTSDGIFTRGMLSKYWIPFIFDVGQFKESLDKIKSVKADFYAPSHGEIYTDISTLHELNMLSVIQNEDCIIQCLKQGSATFEDILKYVADMNEIPIRLSQFMLVGSTIRSYITHLYKTERITWTFKKNKMYWRLAQDQSPTQ